MELKVTVRKHDFQSLRFPPGSNDINDDDENMLPEFLFAGINTNDCFV